MHAMDVDTKRVFKLNNQIFDAILNNVKIFVRVN